MSRPQPTRRPKKDRIRQAVSRLLDSMDRAIAAAEEAKKARREFERIVNEGEGSRT